MIIAKLTLAEAKAAADALSELGNHVQAAHALLALTNDTHVIMTSDGEDDPDTELLINAAEDALSALYDAEERLEEDLEDDPEANMHAKTLARVRSVIEKAGSPRQ